jgi:hypothetical protein
MWTPCAGTTRPRPHTRTHLRQLGLEQGQQGQDICRAGSYTWLDVTLCCCLGASQGEAEESAWAWHTCAEHNVVGSGNYHVMCMLAGQQFACMCSNARTVLSLALNMATSRLALQPEVYCTVCPTCRGAIGCVPENGSFSVHPKCRKGASASGNWDSRLARWKAMRRPEGRCMVE